MNPVQLTFFQWGGGAGLEWKNMKIPQERGAICKERGWIMKAASSGDRFANGQPYFNTC
jgi:hypothetical protein